MRERPQTYAITMVCFERMRIFQRAVNADLLIHTLFRYRDGSRYLLHGFVLMPDHLHVVISPSASLEQAVGLIKGGFSFAVRKQYRGPVWQESYYAHRVLHKADYEGQMEYILRNPERKRMEDYPFVHSQYVDRMDGMPDHLGG